MNDKINRPCGIAFSNDHYWAVTDSSNHCVYIFNGQDQLVRKIGSRGNDAGQFNEPCGVSFDDDNCLYVLDTKGSMVTGHYILQFGRK